MSIKLKIIVIETINKYGFVPVKNLLKIMLSFLFYSIVSMLSSSAYATLVISDNSLSLQFDRCSSPEVRDMVSESILNSGDVSVYETTENTALFKFRYPRNAIHENLTAQFILYNSNQNEITRSSSKALHGSTAGFISKPVGNIDEDKYYVFIAVVLNTDKKKYCTLESETVTITNELTNSSPSLIRSDVTPSNIRVNESVMFQSIWQDPDSDAIFDVKARYRKTGTSTWTEEILDDIGGDVATGYTFNKAVTMTAIGQYEVEFQATDSKNGSTQDTTVYQGNVKFLVKESSNEPPEHVSSSFSPTAIKVDENITFEAVWKDQDSTEIIDVTAYYYDSVLNISDSVILDDIEGDVKTGYTFRKTVPINAKGTYSVTFSASDNDGNTTSFSRGFSPDGEPTEFTVISNDNNLPKPEFKFSGNEIPQILFIGQSYEYSLSFTSDLTDKAKCSVLFYEEDNLILEQTLVVTNGQKIVDTPQASQVNRNYKIVCQTFTGNLNNPTELSEESVWEFQIKQEDNYSLNVGSENGSVTGEGINCPNDCTESYTQESVTNSLTAAPNTGYKFSQWSTSGQCSYQGDLLQSSINITLSGDCTVTASFTTISDSAPILTITQNLESCLTRTDKKCVVLGQTATLKFDIFDNNNNLSMLDVNWDGIDSPEKSHNISGGNTSVESSYIFTNADIADCPNNEYYRNDEVCWKKDIIVTATAYDASNNPSNVFSQEFILYDNDGYNLAKEALENANKELEDKENLLEQQTSQEISYASEIASLSNSCQLNKKFNWEDKNSLLEYDPFRVIDGKPEYCRKDRATLISCASIDSQCSALAGLGAGINYEIKTTYDYESYVVSADCKNYPARVESSYTIDGVKTEYETKFVNNHTQKIDYLTSVSNRLKDELITQGSDRYVGKCNLDDYKEWGLSDWQKAIESHPDFEETIQTILRKTDFSLNQVVKIRIEFKKGQAKALMDFVSAYAELPSDVAAVIGSSLKFVRDSWDDPSGTADRLVENTGELNEFASQLYQEFIDAVPLIPAAISHWSLEDLAYTNGYAQTRISLEIGVTLVSGGSAQGAKWAVKYGKATKYSDIKWMTSLINAVNSYKYGVKASKKVLNSLSPDSSNKFRETFRLGTDKDKQEAANLFHKDVGNKELVDEIENNVGKRAQALGKAGEKIVAENYNIGTRTTFEIDGRTRISDGYIKGESLTEVKNVKEQGLTLQIKDNIQYAKDKGIKFNLYIRESAYLSKPLLKAVNTGDIKIIFVDMPH
ncbi:MAG TPA: hypothetical protein ENH88_04710 [Pseudoalteromonas prydzensis]|uniref:Bacterial repeat domain-containing protein n=3 Tax=root TaxID=1 RepID=A0A7V1CWQ3_9GAMM|nr:putative toxin [Pseudoalteromonas prydzensis]HEA15746.1 hypothetical protein [Pseudoalteromonas prydzensis]